MRKIIYALSAGIILSGFLFMPHDYAFADDVIIDNNTAYVPIEGTDNIQGGSSGSSETSSNTSSSSSSSETNMSLEEAIAIASAARDTLKGYVSQMERSMMTVPQSGDSATSDSGLLKVAVTQNNPLSATNFTMLTIPMSEMTSLADDALRINNYLDDADAAAFNGSTGGTASATADDVMVYNEADGSEGTYIEYEDFFADDIAEYWNAIADQEGLLVSPLETTTWTIPSYLFDGSGHTISWNENDTLSISDPSYYFIFTGGSGSSSVQFRLPNGGFRTDLLSGGFCDADSWSERFSIYAGQSNTFEDDFVLGLFDEYRISSITTGVYENIVYDGDFRKWIVTDAETGEEILTTYTNNAEHQLILANPGVGRYVITEYQRATYTESTYVSYVKSQYLIDANTKNLLYFNENASNGSICVQQDSQEGYIATSSVTIRVNELGEIEHTDSGIERVE